MKITLESTTKIVRCDGVDMRIWEGATESGIACHAFVARIAVANDIDSGVFDAELRECRSPSAAIDRAYGIDPRLIL
jgi:hypothetical protein